MSIKFEVGKIYGTASICDSDCIFTYRIVSRTEKSVVVEEIGHDGKAYGKAHRCKIHDIGRGEFIYPSGRYSMCPVLEPSDLIAA